MRANSRTFNSGDCSKIVCAQQDLVFARSATVFRVQKTAICPHPLSKRFNYICINSYPHGDQAFLSTNPNTDLYVHKVNESPETFPPIIKNISNWRFFHLFWHSPSILRGLFWKTSEHRLHKFSRSNLNIKYSFLTKSNWTNVSAGKLALYDILDLLVQCPLSHWSHKIFERQNFVNIKLSVVKIFVWSCLQWNIFVLPNSYLATC